MPQCLLCGETFTKMQGLTRHKNSCSGSQRAIRTSSRAQRIALPRLQKAKLQRKRDGKEAVVERQELREAINQPSEDDCAPLDNALEDNSIAGPSNIRPPTPPPPIVTKAGRKRKLPQMYRDLAPSELRMFSKRHGDLAQLLEPSQLPLPPSTVPTPQSPIVNTNTTSALPTLPEPLEPEPHERPTSSHITEPNRFDLFRVYSKIPQHDPVAEATTDMCTDSPTIAVPSRAEGLTGGSPLRVFGQKVRNQVAEWFSPLSNASSALLMKWQYNGQEQKSAGELQRLVDDVIQSPDFNKSDFANYSVSSELDALDEFNPATGMFSAEDGWRTGSVSIRLPKEKTKHNSESDAPEFTVDGIWYRPLLSVIKSAYEDPTQKHFHNVPFTLFRRNNDNSDALDPEAAPEDVDLDNAERVWTDVYNSDALIEAQAQLDAMPRNPEDDPSVEYVIAAGMGYSDTTQLTNFGSAYLWPFYTWMAMLTKYLRAKPTFFAAHHTAYIPKLPSLVQDYYHKVYKMAATPDVLRFCRSELLQKIWVLLLDADFMHAYEHGILVRCGDGILRRLFPRIITYSADYPERVSLACLRFLGNCPCPTCLVEKKNIAAMGSKSDMKKRAKARTDDKHTQGLIARARAWIFERGYNLRSKMSERLLHPLSLLPTRSTFSERFSQFGVNFYSMFVPDVLHEFELGVFKAFFAHILRVLFAFGPDNITKLNSRFRRVPTFGRNTIRKFVENVSSRSNFTAYDYENVLKCAMPVVEGLLSEPMNTIVLNLLWACAVWHALAKLRLHTESTLSALEVSTTILGDSARRFSKECDKDKYDIRELPAEEYARHRRKTRQQEKKHAKDSQPSKTAQQKPGDSKGKGKEKASGPKQKRLNLQTFKWHNLGHYAAAIRRFGPTDGYSTQMGELEHRRVKRFYARTSRKNYSSQIVQHIRREKILSDIFERETARRHRIAKEPRDTTGNAPKIRKRGRPRKDRPVFGFCDADPLTAAPFRAQHQMSDSNRDYVDLTTWVLDNAHDPAMKDFIPTLKNHLIPRLKQQDFSGDEHQYSDKERLALQFENNSIYFHKALRTAGKTSRPNVYLTNIRLILITENSALVDLGIT